MDVKNKQIVEILAEHFGHSAFKIIASQEQWSYRMGEPVARVAFRIGPIKSAAIVAVDSRKVEVDWFGAGFGLKSGDVANDVNLADLDYAILCGIEAAKKANQDFQFFANQTDTEPRCIKCIFFFAIDGSIRFGFDYQEFGLAEPFLSIKI